MSMFARTFSSSVLKQQLRRPTRAFSSSSSSAKSYSPLSATTLTATALTASLVTYALTQSSSRSPYISLDSLSDLFRVDPQPASLSEHFGTPKDFLSAIDDLKAALPDNDQVSTDADVLLAHAMSPHTYHAARNPAVVVFAQSTDDVVKVVNISRKYKVPITPFSGGTSLEGHITAPFGGISLDLSRMDNILQINEKDSDMIVQAGCGWEQINEHLKDEGIPLFFPLDPGSGATIGGMMATGCSGTNAVRYGTAKGEWFLNATVVLPSGEVIKTRQRARKSSAGFDTTKLFIGAEGTLGIVTEATIRLTPLLPTSVAICNFPDLEKASECVYDILNSGAPIQCIELLCDTMMKAINDAGMSDRRYAERDSLMIKFQGSPGMIAESSRLVSDIVPKHGGKDLRFAESDEESAAIWRGRKAAHWSAMAMSPGAKAWSTDVCLPVSKLPLLVRETQADLKKRGLISAVVGHVGDGNFHTSILFSNQAEYEIASAAVHHMVDRAIALDGTCTGEHGVGVGKREFLLAELGEGTVELMRTVKRAIDPLGLFNPGKLYPDEGPIVALKRS